MKKRFDFVTNSSSSSFLITNTTDQAMTSREVAESLVSKILSDAEGRFELAPGQSIVYECGDSGSDGAFENFIHANEGWYLDNYSDGRVAVEFEESHH